MVALRPAVAAERDSIRALLCEEQLPVDDLDQSTVEFLVADDDGKLVGAIGLERYDEHALLRSLVVRRAHRAAGVGASLVGAIETQARNEGIAALVLLTQTASEFFARRGYRSIERNDAPSAIRTSAEFRSLCPASATCMIKPLEQPA
jgi:amino-acid N-acetyltransferase